MREALRPGRLRAQRVDEASTGSVLRVALRAVSEPEALVQRELAQAGIAFRNMRGARPNVEDAFVSMVRAEQELHDSNGRGP